MWCLSACGPRASHLHLMQERRAGGSRRSEGTLWKSAAPSALWERQLAHDQVRRTACTSLVPVNTNLAAHDYNTVLHEIACIVLTCYGTCAPCSTDKHAAENPLCASAFLSSSKSLDPTPQKGEARMRIMPKLKSTHEHCPVMGNDQVRPLYAMPT